MKASSIYFYESCISFLDQTDKAKARERQRKKGERNNSSSFLRKRSGKVSFYDAILMGKVLAILMTGQQKQSTLFRLGT
jgi:hypothetical protein